VCVTWNRKVHVSNMLAALSRQTYPRERMDVIVVDNSSTDGTLEHIAETWRPEAIVDNPTQLAHEPAFAEPRRTQAPGGNLGGWGSLTVIRNGANMGGCGGFNTGFGYVDRRLALDHPGRGDVGFVWLVDDDAEAPDDALEQLTRAAGTDPSIGLVGSRTVSILDHKTTIESTIYYDLRTGSMSDEPAEHHPLHASHRAWIARVGGTKGERTFHGLRDVDIVSACSMLARWDAAKRVGFWDYRYFIYCDDADWCLRFAAAGYRVVLNLDAVIYHTPWNLKLTPARIYYAQRNAVWMAQKVVPFVGGPAGLRRGLRRVTGGWMKTLLKDALRAATHRRLFHADIIRSTAHDIAIGRWGKTGSDGPASEPVIDALAKAGVLSGGARVALMCTTAPMLAAARDLRRHVREQVAARGKGEQEPTWIEVVRDGLPEPAEDGGVSVPAQRVIFGHTLKSRIFRQKSLIARPPRAVVVFDQTNDMPLVTGGWNIHIDLKKPGSAQIERDGVLARARFGWRWARSLARCGWYALRVRPYDRAHQYGWRPESVVNEGGSSRGALAARGAAAPTPPGWPVSDRPLNVAILGWARLSAQQWEGSGYNWSASELARGLVMSGHRVNYLQSGMTYRMWGGPRVVHRERWGGVECFDLVNSPNLSPASSNFQNMAVEMSCPAQTRLVLQWLARVGASVVHIHSLEGYGLDLIRAIKASGRGVVVTPHNYWYVCPQVDLLHHETRVCLDYDGGKRCVGCLPSLPPAKMKRKRRVGQTLERLTGLYTADVIRKTIYGVKPAAKKVLRGRIPRPEPLPKLNPDWLVDPELAHGFAYTDPLPQHPSRSTHAPGATDHSGEIVHDITIRDHDRPKPFDAAAPDANERIVAARDRHLVVLNEYGRRRAAGVEALNAADLVIPPSDFLRRLHVSMGVDEHRTRWVRLGQPHFDQINRRARRSPYYDVRPWDPANATRPLRFGFFGTTRSNKGVEVLAAAIPLLPRDVRKRCHITIRAHGWELPLRKRLARFPEVTVYAGYDLYQLIGAAGEYDVGLLPHIWLENSPLVMLEHLHAGKFMVASRLGGPPDWILEGRNGMLFTAGRPDELAACMTKLITGEVEIPSPREVHAASTLWSYPDHVREVEGVYREVLGERPAAPARPRAEVVTVRPGVEAQAGV
jgi:GT2 family glycosyltransferase/glycosyltransferase involved in cell wall biosynthesis